MPRARNRLGPFVGYAKGLFGSFSPDALATPFFLVLIVPEPLFFSIRQPKLENSSLFPAGGVEPGFHLLHFSKTPPFVRPSISLVFPLFSQVKIC